MTTYDRIAYRNGTSAPATVTVEMDLTNPDHQVHSTVTVSLLGVEHSATADDAFEALSLVRAALDRDCWLLGVQGLASTCGRAGWHASRVVACVRTDTAAVVVHASTTWSTCSPRPTNASARWRHSGRSSE